MASNPQPPIYAVVGPTASGKTEIGVELALRLKNAEIINCDSVQIYKKIQIATAKPSADEMKGVTHHLLDYVPPERNYTAQDWAEDATRKIEELQRRNIVPILVGGTGFYLRSLRSPLFKGPKTDKVLRERLKTLVDQKGPEHLFKILKRLDPISSERLSPRDYVRTMRALEVFIQTGKSITEWQKESGPPPEFARRLQIFALRPDREELYARINERTQRHFENGLVDEVTKLRNTGLRDDTNALGSHGYRRVCEYLRGERSLESAIEKTQQDVRNYAKRQFSWFRREGDVVWIDGFGDDPSTQSKLFELLDLA